VKNKGREDKDKGEEKINRRRIKSVWF